MTWATTGGMNALVLKGDGAAPQNTHRIHSTSNSSCCVNSQTLTREVPDLLTRRKSPKCVESGNGVVSVVLRTVELEGTSESWVLSLFIFTNEVTEAPNIVDSFSQGHGAALRLGQCQIQKFAPWTCNSLHDSRPALIWQTSMASRILCKSHIIYIYDVLNNSEKVSSRVTQLSRFLHIRFPSP